MGINELTEQVKKKSGERTREDNVKMLKSANIIDNKGFYSQGYFSPETVEKDKKSGNAFL